MDEKVLAAAKAVLNAHKSDDCTGTAAAGVALAHMIVQRADARPSRFSFDIEEPEEKAGPTVKP